MNVDDMIIISIDDHVVEPPDMFDAHVPAKYRDQAPKLVRDAQTASTTGSSRARRWGWSASTPPCPGPKRSGDSTPAPWPRCGPAAYLFANGSATWIATACWHRCAFPSFVGFAGRKFIDAQDKDLALVMLKAYNDWHIDEWCAPSRHGSSRWRSARCGTWTRWSPRSIGSRPRGRPRHHHARAAAPIGPASLPERLLGPVLQRAVRRGHGHVPAHRPGPRRHQHGARLLL